MGEWRGVVRDPFFEHLGEGSIGVDEERRVSCVAAGGYALRDTDAVGVVLVVQVPRTIGVGHISAD